MRSHYVAALAAVAVERLGSTGGADMAGAGAHHRQRAESAADGRPCPVEFRLDQVARLEVRRIGVGNVFGEHPLALLMPLHLGAQRRQDRKIVDGHG